MVRAIERFALVYSAAMRHTMRAVILTCLVAASAHAQQKIAVFIGPQTRDGFIDMDAGIRDSIKDIQQECQQGTVFSIAPTSENAALTLIVLGQGTPVSGSVGSAPAVGGIAFGFVAPNASPPSRRVCASASMNAYPVARAVPGATPQK